MTLKKFNTDLSGASQKVAVGAVAGVQSLSKGDSEGEVVINYRHESFPRPVPIRALATLVDEYPDGNTFLLFTNEETPPQVVADTIERFQDYLFGMRVYEMVTELSNNLHAALDEGAGRQGTESSSDSQNEDEDAEEGGGGYDEEDYDEYSLDDDAFRLSTAQPVFRHPGAQVQPSKEQLLMRQRLRRDLRLAKQAGYKVGVLDDTRQSGTEGIISISIRAQKLGLSIEAMEAWDVECNDYIVLLVKFGSYTPVERVIEQPSSFTHLQFRIGKCTRYKPSFRNALAAFDRIASQSQENEPSAQERESHPEQEFRKLFISNSLDQYLNECFISLLKLRASRKCSWDDANLALESKVITGHRAGNPVSEATHSHGIGSSGDPMDVDATLEDHRNMPSDHFSQPAPEHGRSLVLIAMEFAMHYFVKCTEYCLRCHQRVDKGFEALRPYVCSKPLCLFQYMAMGLGPSVEHEILTQPYVVDLLVNLCYAALDPHGNGYLNAPNPVISRQRQEEGCSSSTSSLPIRELPVGLPMTVPNLMESGADPLKARWPGGPTERSLLVLDRESLSAMDDRLSCGKWIAFRQPGANLTHHAVVIEVDSVKRWFYVKMIGDSGRNWSPVLYGTGISSEPRSVVDDTLVEIIFYDTDVDTLPLLQKGGTLRHILDTMPPILEIAKFLTSNPHSSLRSVEGMSGAAASLLQWIVSSNRSCIHQVDSNEEIFRSVLKPATLAEPSFEPPTKRKSRDHERIPGMPGWIQFRFAQGSPDKELRFKRALQEVASRQPISQTPTIFAWHGSGLSNWHSIVRSGLDFAVTKNGRAYGNGVYFSPNYATSVGYSSRSNAVWGNSALGFSICMSLNEIINCPSEFVSKEPHYVVAQLDWHQCRYLFVQANRLNSAVPPEQTETPDQRFHVQAPGLKITGPNNAELRIPLAAIPFRQVGAGLETQSLPTKRTSISREEDESAEEDSDDVKFLFSDEESDEVRGPPSKKPGGHARPVTPASTDTVTDFQPGTLDLSTLPTMEQPKSATDFATKALGRELKRLQETQSKTPLHELGWYMDFDKMDNIFQWIVEFHSFDPSLPLAQDMKKLGVASIVFEIRFGANYPVSPPFVRVIRPRFLPFAEGGGGHVTAGGAMCMELLTNSGCSPATTMVSVFLQVRMALCNLDPWPARLNDAVKLKHSPSIVQTLKYCNDYKVGEAIEAYLRAVRLHGWTAPDDLRQTATGL